MPACRHVPYFAFLLSLQKCIALYEEDVSPFMQHGISLTRLGSPQLPRYLRPLRPHISLTYIVHLGGHVQQSFIFLFIHWEEDIYHGWLLLDDTPITPWHKRLSKRLVHPVFWHTPAFVLLDSRYCILTNNIFICLLFWERACFFMGEEQKLVDHDTQISSITYHS